MTNRIQLVPTLPRGNASLDGPPSLCRHTHRTQSVRTCVPMQERGNEGKRIRILPILCVVLVFVALPGCGKKVPPTGEVSGTVTFKGKPLPEGVVAFVNTEEGRRGEGSIKDGQYTVPNAPVGPCGVEVVVNIAPVASGRSVSMEKRMRQKFEQAKQRGADIGGDISFEPLNTKKSEAVQIPLRYANAKVSGISCTVEKGAQTFDITLQP